MRKTTHKIAGWLAIPVSLLLHIGCATTESPTPQPTPTASAHHDEDARHVPGSPFAKVFAGEADIVVLTFFDLYCVACQQSASTFNELHKRIDASLGEMDVQLTGIGVGDTEFELEVFQRKYNLTYRSLPDADKEFEAPFALRGTPTVLVFRREDGKCREIYRHEGRFRSNDIDLLLETVRKTVTPQ
jgi:hypothetical protein